MKLIREICDGCCSEINLIRTFRHYREVATDVASCICDCLCDHLLYREGEPSLINSELTHIRPSIISHITSITFGGEPTRSLLSSNPAGPLKSIAVLGICSPVNVESSLRSPINVAVAGSLALLPGTGCGSLWFL